MKEFVFWQPTLSIHQSALLRSLAASSGAKVTLVIEEEVVAQRRGLGWHRPDFGETRIIVRPTPKVQSELLSGDLSNSVHIFSGTRGSGSVVWNAFCRGLSSDAHIGIYSEAHKGMGLVGFLRLLRSKYDALRFGERVDFILGVGTLGVDWYKKSGYSHDKIFPFGYFVETPLLRSSYLGRQALSDRFFDLIFVGQFIFRKGWDILLYALAGVDGLNWRLHVVGGGVDRDKVIGLCTKLGLADPVHFYGTLPNPEALGLVSRSDLLVLPSRWDGWGAVVNEALMCGVPVVCSNKCGAADLLDGRVRGEVFPSGSISALRSLLYRRISQGKKDAVASEKIKEWSKCISGESAADYLMAVVRASITGGSRPIPPWFEQSGA